jgi:hypothetical protein
MLLYNFSTMFIKFVDNLLTFFEQKLTKKTAKLTFF